MRTLLILLLAALPLSAQELVPIDLPIKRTVTVPLLVMPVLPHVPLAREDSTPFDYLAIRSPRARDRRETATVLTGAEQLAIDAAMFKEKAAFAKTKAGKICSRDIRWRREECEAMAAKKVWIGMTAEQASVSWGRPCNINRTVASYGTHEQWVYCSYYPYQRNHAYLYFENGVLTTIQQEGT